MGEDVDIQTWETLSAYVDGELDEFATALVERAVHGDRRIATALASLYRQRRDLRSWAAALDARPVPAGARAMIETARPEPCCSGNGDGRCGKHSD